MNNLVRTFKSLVVAFVIIVGANGAAADSMEAKMSALEERILDLEAQNALTRYRLSGVFINRFEDLTNYHGAPGAEKEKDVVKPFGMYLGLNLDFDITKRLKFYSTLAMSKFYNSEGRSESLSGTSGTGRNTYQATEMGGWAFAGSQLKVDRAYASYEMEDAPITWAFGRMPTNNGPPANQLDGVPRSGTYPRFIFNAIFDGFAMVVDGSRFLPSWQTLKLRAFYQPFTFIDDSDRTKQYVDGIKVESQVKQGAAILEYSMNDMKYLKRLDLMYLHAQWKDFYTGYSDATTGQPAGLGSPMTGQVEDGSDDGFYVGFERVMNSGLNVSWTGLFYKAVDSGLPDLHKQAWGHLVDASYRFTNNWIVGAEYISTAKYFYLDEWTRLNLLPFYSLQSAHGYHFFFTVPLGSKVSTRVGYMKVNAGEGDVFQPDEFKMDSYYAQIRLDF